MTLVWSETSISECPGCGGTVVVGIMSLCATCRTCGMYYVDTETHRGWYFSRAAYENGAPPVPCPWALEGDL